MTETTYRVQIRLSDGTWVNWRYGTPVLTDARAMKEGLDLPESRRRVVRITVITEVVG